MVQGLSPGVKYYFRVRTGNGCAVGAWSKEVSVRTVVFPFLPLLETLFDLPSQIGKEGHKEYKVTVKVLGTDGTPLKGAVVTLHSDPKTEKTGDDGVVVFENVEKGEHQIAVSYLGKTGEKEIQLDSNTNEEYKFTITLNEERPFSHWSEKIAIILLVILLLGVLFHRKRFKSKT